MELITFEKTWNHTGPETVDKQRGIVELKKN